MSQLWWCRNETTNLGFLLAFTQPTYSIYFQSSIVMCVCVCRSIFGKLYVNRSCRSQEIMLLLLVCLGLRCQSREQKEWHGCRATKVRRTSRSRHFVCFYLVPASVVEPVSISTGSGSCGRLRKKMYKQIMIKIQFWIIKKIVLLLLKQCCGAATFLGGSGSGRPRSRSRLRLQA